MAGRADFDEHSELCKCPATCWLEPTLSGCLRCRALMGAYLLWCLCRLNDRLDLACFGGYRPYILPPLSPSQPAIADENMACWGTFLNFFAFFAPQAQHSTAQLTRTSSKASTRRSERDNASKLTELARASLSSIIYVARCVLKTNEEIEIGPA